MAKYIRPSLWSRIQSNASSGPAVCQLLKSRIVPNRIPERVEPQQRGCERIGRRFDDQSLNHRECPIVITENEVRAGDTTARSSPRRNRLWPAPSKRHLRFQQLRCCPSVIRRTQSVHCKHRCAGELKYNNPADYHWFRFTGITPEALKEELATGKGDGEMLAWIEQKALHKRTPWEIQQWSAYFNERGPDGDVETLEFFTKRVGDLSKTREDVRTWSDYLDLDDHVTFGGKA